GVLDQVGGRVQVARLTGVGEGEPEGGPGDPVERAGPLPDERVAPRPRRGRVDRRGVLADDLVEAGPGGGLAAAPADLGGGGAGPRGGGAGSAGGSGSRAGG